MLTFALCATLALAADPQPPLALTEVAFGTGFGVMPINLGALNSSLHAKGDPRLGPLQITPLAVNGELWIGRVVPGFDYIEWSNVGAEDAGHKDTRLSYSLTELSLGYGVVYKPKFNFEPRIGFGLSNLDVVVNRTGNADFASGALDPQRSFALHRGDMLADVGVGVGWMIPLTKVDHMGVGTGLRIAFRVGGLMQLFHTSPWQADGEKVDDVPGVYLGGPYVRLFVSPSLLLRYPRAVKVPKAP